MINRGALGEFAMPSLRLDRRLALACLVLLLLMNGAALAGTVTPTQTSRAQS